MFIADRRFPTSNTNLAACLAALRIPIKTEDPVYVVEESESEKSRRSVTFFFEEESAPNNDGLPIEKAERVDWAWRHREEFERENPKHPLVYMRRALDKLEWLIAVKYGRIKLSPRPGEGKCRVEDIILAAVIMGAGHELHSFLSNDVFVFDIPEDVYEAIVEEYECFRHGKDPVCYMRRVLECRKLLIGLVKKAPVLLHYHNGDPMDGGREGYIAKGISPSKLNQFFDLLYE